eukprot:gene10004-11727_t
MNYKEAVLKAPAVPAVPPLATQKQKSAQTTQQHAVKAKKEQPKEKFSAAVINSCYGGFEVSDFAVELYRKRYEKKYCKKSEESGYGIGGDDPILVALVKEFPTQVSGKYSKQEVVYYPSKYDGFFRVSEYDGLERGYIDVSAYKLATINKIASSTLAADVVVTQIQAVLNDSYADAKACRSLPAEIQETAQK